mgnify:CR=1 FL=1
MYSSDKIGSFYDLLTGKIQDLLLVPELFSID